MSTYAPLAFNSTTGASTYNVYNNSGSMRVIFDAAGTLDLYPGGTTSTVSGAPSLAAAADRTLGSRTIPGARTFANGHEGSTHRRG